jgi:hypothetical protein
MTRYGYFLSSEEHEPQELVRQAKRRKRPASMPSGSLAEAGGQCAAARGQFRYRA